MSKLIVKPEVRAALRAAFPKPAASAGKILDKYVGVLAHLIDTAMQQQRSVYMRKKGLYSIPVSTLQQSGQLGVKRIRLHKWLDENGYALVEKVETGTNLTGRYSLVALTKWITLGDELTDNGELQELSDKQIDEYLSDDETGETELVKRLYAELLQGLSEEEITKLFDFVPVDVKSLANYVTWLLTEAKLIKQAQKQSYIRQAKTILTISKKLNGLYPQRKVKSDFGRTYYAGLSVQNVNKDLRRAMLGDCWEYDVRSSVVAWKMSFAKVCLLSAGLGADVKHHFSATLWLLEEKVVMFKQIQEKTFAGDSKVPADLQINLIKQAMTAICFGARLQLQGWRTGDGNWQNPAIVDIIKNADERKSFMTNKDVKDFVREQNMLDNYLFNGVKKEAPELLKQSFLVSNSRPNKAKTIAYLYQNSEAKSMSAAYDYLMRKNIEVLAKIHDAFIVQKKLTGENKVDLQVQVQHETDNEYWRLGEKQIERWGDVMSLEEKQRIATHKTFIAAEEIHAKKYIESKRQ